MEEKKEWFAEWFDNPYYHVLYNNRDYEEAEGFITNLIAYLNPKSDARILDLACGEGRYSIYLNNMGFNVTGVDLAANSIESANVNLNDHLSFDVHDMREVYKKNEFDYIFSMFTSFGYFEDSSENIKMIASVKEGLKEEGTFVLDFMNAKKVIEHLVEEEEKEVDGVHFYLKRFFKDGFIQKNIKFLADGELYNYTEKVQGVFLEEMKTMFEAGNMKIIRTFGDYQLNEFNEKTSDRLIIVAKK